MTKWNKEETEFEVSVTYSDNKGSKVNMPKPILTKLGNPKKIRFVIEGMKILVEA